MEKTTIEKLRILLPHWVEHSHQHGAEFRKWVELARAEGHSEIAELLEQAITAMATTDTILEKALSLLGGAENGHSHHHHHGHHHH